MDHLFLKEAGLGAHIRSDRVLLEASGGSGMTSLRPDLLLLLAELDEVWLRVLIESLVHLKLNGVELHGHFVVGLDSDRPIYLALGAAEGRQLTLASFQVDVEVDLAQSGIVVGSGDSVPTSSGRGPRSAMSFELLATQQISCSDDGPSLVKPRRRPGTVTFAHLKQLNRLGHSVIQVLVGLRLDRLHGLNGLAKQDVL